MLERDKFFEYTLIIYCFKYLDICFILMNCQKPLEEFRNAEKSPPGLCLVVCAMTSDLHVLVVACTLTKTGVLGVCQKSALYNYNPNTRLKGWCQGNPLYKHQVIFGTSLEGVLKVDSVNFLKIQELATLSPSSRRISRKNYTNYYFENKRKNSSFSKNKTDRSLKCL